MAALLFFIFFIFIFTLLYLFHHTRYKNKLRVEEKKDYRESGEGAKGEITGLIE